MSKRYFFLRFVHHNGNNTEVLCISHVFHIIIFTCRYIWLCENRFVCSMWEQFIECLFANIYIHRWRFSRIMKLICDNLRKRVERQRMRENKKGSTDLILCILLETRERNLRFFTYTHADDICSLISNDLAMVGARAKPQRQNGEAKTKSALKN